MDDRVQILRRDRRQDPDLRAAPLAQVCLRVTRPRVDDDVVAPRGEARRELLRERLEPAVARGDAARAEDADAHAAQSRPAALCRRPRISRRLARSRPRFFQSQPNAGSELRSTVRQAPTTTRSRASVGTSVRTSFPRGLVVDAEEETILDRVEIGERRHLLPPFRKVAAPVKRARRGDVQAAPAQAPQPPRQVRVLAVEEKVGIEAARRDPRAFERRAAIETRGARRTDDLLLGLEPAGGLFSGAAVEVPPGRREVNPRRVETSARRQARTVAAEQPPRGRPDLRRVRRVEPARQRSTRSPARAGNPD